MAVAAVLPISAVLSPKKQVKHVEKLESMWPSADSSKAKGGKRIITKEGNSVNKSTTRSSSSSSIVGGGGIREALRVVRSDVEFIGTATAPIRKAVGDFFWFRFLEKKPVSGPKHGDDLVTTPRQQELPALSPYPQGMISSCYYEISN